MASITISLSVEAYNQLKRLKLENESFSQEILRLVGNYAFIDFAGSLSKKEASELEKNIREMRKGWKVREWR